MQTQRNWTYMYTYKMFKTFIQWHITLIAPVNVPFSVSTKRQKSSSSDAETFRRPVCRWSVKCQQKDGTNHGSRAVSKMKVDMFDSRPSTSRDEAAIGQLKIGVVVHDVASEETFIFLDYLLLLLRISRSFWSRFINWTMSQSGDRLKQLEEIEKVRSILAFIVVYPLWERCLRIFKRNEQDEKIFVNCLLLGHSKGYKKCRRDLRGTVKRCSFRRPYQLNSYQVPEIFRGSK